VWHISLTRSPFSSGLVLPSPLECIYPETNKTPPAKGWFIFTTILTLLTLRSTVAFFLLFLTLDLAFFFLALGYAHRNAKGTPTSGLIKTGGFFGLLASFLAWYNALAGIADDSNRYVCICLFWNLTHTIPSVKSSRLTGKS
jgi:hypothetical protein